MSIRNLDSLFDPASVAVVGASRRRASVGATVWLNLRAGAFKGPVYAVNPKYTELDGEPVYARAADLPSVPELAVLCTPPVTVPGLISELGALGTRAAIVLTAGLDAAQRQAMGVAARKHLLRILGPNCIGLIAPRIGLNASFAHTDALPGEIAFVTQSGALMTAMLDWARTRGIGFSHFVSLGERADVDFGDTLDYLASDGRTRAILLYMESITAPRKFMSAARSAARNKPVIVVKSGRSSRGQQAAASHTGALAGSDVVFDAAIRRAGMLRVDTLDQLFLAAETLARFRENRSDRLAVLTNGGGAGVMAADAAAHTGVTLAELGADTLQRLAGILPANWSGANPVDVIGDAPVERYVKALQALLDDPEAGAILVIHAPTAIVPSADIARALLPLARAHPPRLMGCWLGDAAVADARRLFQQAGIASYATPEEAVRAFAMLVTYRANQAELLETPPAAAPGAPADIEKARRLLDEVLPSGREMLSEPEAKAVLEASGIPVVPTRTVAPDPGAAADAAEAIGFPVALKVISAQLSHKSDVGGVVLDLASAAAVRDAASAMLARVREVRPDAHVDGFSVQAMVRRAHAHELIVGASIDSVFGPVVLFGHGGTAVAVVADRAVALPPLNACLARALVSRTRVARLLAGFRDTPPADCDALYGVIVAVSQLLADIPQIAELDINPLLLNHEGAVALDARIRVSAKGPAGAGNFAIKPYPAQLVERAEWQGRTLTLRPIRPEDEHQHDAFLRRLDPEDIRLRIFYSRRSIEHSELARLTQIDYAREMAFIATEAAGGGEHTLGVVRAVIDPDNVTAEFGILIRSDLKGSGLGELLMRKMIAFLREHGTQQLVATVLDENHRMRALARRLGLEDRASPAGDGTRELMLRLRQREEHPPAARAG
jgi:acetyltransferase